MVDIALPFPACYALRRPTGRGSCASPLANESFYSSGVRLSFSLATGPGLDGRLPDGILGDTAPQVAGLNVGSA